MAARWKRLAVPLIILAFPVAFWLIISRGENHLKRLPVIGPADVAANGDTIYHTIADFSLTNQEGKVITQADLTGKIYVANFFFATCPTICPKMNENFRKVQQEFKGSNDVRMVSYTVDPEQDSVPALKAYAEKMYADNSFWCFLTGNKDSIYTLARESYLVPAASGKTAEDFFHSDQLILIDKEKRIRGLYDGMDPYAVDTLIAEMKVLLHEYVEEK